MLVIAALVILGVVILAIEIYAGANASLVITEGPSAEAERVSLARQASFAGDGPNDIDTFEAIMLEVQAATREMSDQWLARDSEEDDPWDYPSFDHIYVVPDEGTQEQFERAQERAREALSEWERRGVFNRSVELLSLGPIARRPTLNAMDEVMYEWMGATRALSRALAARAHIAAENGDHISALDSIEQMMVLGRQVAGMGYLIDWIVGLAIQHVARDTLLDIMLRHPGFDEAWLDRASAITERELVDRVPRLADALQGERHFSADVVQRAFTDNGKGPGKTNGRFLPVQFAELIEGGFIDVPRHMLPFGNNKLSNIHGRLFLDRAATNVWLDGAFERHRRAADALGEEAIEADREMRQYVNAVTWRNPMAMNLFQLGTARWSERSRQIYASGTLVVLAIERHRLSYGGTIPASLEDIDDALPEHLRTDPFTGQPWAYQPTPRTLDVDDEPLRDGSLIWPYTIRSSALPAMATQSGDQPNRHAFYGVLITEPIQGPKYDEPAADPDDS